MSRKTPAVQITDPGLFGYDPIDPSRYTSPDFMAREWSHMWTKVWNMGPRIVDIPEPGDYVLHELGKESFVFVRGEDGEVRGFYNVCQHRGNRLCLGSELGSLKDFTCSFHGWKWHIDGSLKAIHDPHTFPQFENGRMPDLDLSTVRVGEWAGWIWFCMDLNGPSLQEFLGVLPEHLDPYEIQNMTLVDYKTYEWDCNWKVGCDAFNESYHFTTLHPQMTEWADDFAEIEIHGIHSRMIQEYATASKAHGDTEKIGPNLAYYMRNLLGIDPDAFAGKRPADVRLEVQRRARAVENDTHLPYKNLRDDQLSDDYHYTIFPNVSFNVMAASINGFRYRPHPTDPNKMLYDLLVLFNMPPGAPAADYEHRTITDRNVHYSKTLDIDMDPTIVEVLMQDKSTVGGVQAGLRSDGYKGMHLGTQELRVRHLHAMVDKYLGADL
jgi:phenylpropionate dioxygenase-like ring-hydroxylating dioxygenase large terminal subunit